MEKNIGRVDRIIRFVFGAVLFYLVFTINNKLLMILFIIFGAILILESFIGFCGLYSLFKINTKK